MFALFIRIGVIRILLLFNRWSSIRSGLFFFLVGGRSIASWTCLGHSTVNTWSPNQKTRQSVPEIPPVRVRGVDGEEVVVDTFGPTDFFGELAMLHEGPRTASVVATEETECLALSRWEFLAKLRTDPEMAIALLAELAERFQRTMGTL